MYCSRRSRRFARSIVGTLNRVTGKREGGFLGLTAQQADSIKALERFHKDGGSGVRINLRKEKEWDPDDPLFKVMGDLGLIVSVIGHAENFAAARFKKLLDNCPGTHFCLEHLARSPGGDVVEAPYGAYAGALECAKWANT